MHEIISRHLLKVGAWLIGFSLLGIAGYFYLQKKRIEQVDLPIINCDLRSGPCSAHLPTGQTLSLKITPTNMPVLTSVVLEVRTPDQLHVKKMKIHFKGKEMDMGEFNYEFKMQKSGVYTAQTILPTCVHDEMVWQAILNISSKKTSYTVPFILINEKPKSLHS